MGPATERVYREALESDEHQALLDEVSYRGARRGLSKRDTAILLAEEWEEFTLENFPDDAVHVDFAACAVRFINEHWIEGRARHSRRQCRRPWESGLGCFDLRLARWCFCS